MKTTGTPFTSPNFSWILWAQNYTGWFQVNVEAFLHFLPISQLRAQKKESKMVLSRICSLNCGWSVSWIKSHLFTASAHSNLRLWACEPKLCSTISTTRMQIWSSPPFISPFCLVGSCQTSHICRSNGSIDQRSPHRTCFYLLIGRRSKCCQLLFQDPEAPSTVAWWHTIFRPPRATANNEDWQSLSNKYVDIEHKILDNIYCIDLNKLSKSPSNPPTVATRVSPQRKLLIFSCGTGLPWSPRKSCTVARPCLLHNGRVWVNNKAHGRCWLSFSVFFCSLLNGE